MKPAPLGEEDERGLTFEGARRQSALNRTKWTAPIEGVGGGNPGGDCPLSD
jgi:hypothetical protein